MQKLTRLVKRIEMKLGRTVSLSKKTKSFKPIERLIIFLTSIFIVLVSSHQNIINSEIIFIDLFKISLETFLYCSALIIVSKKENSMISFNQVILLLSFLLLAQVIKTNFEVNPIAIIVPPSLIISQGLGTLTSLTWVAVSAISWPDSTAFNNNDLFLITIISAIIVAIIGGKVRNRAQLLQLAIFVSLGVFIVESILIYDKTPLIGLENSLPIDKIYSQSVAVLVSLLITNLVMPIFESVFGLLTKARLLELADQENPILRRLSIEAPGTYEHTLLICGLAEEATRMIRGDVDLIKTGGLYHDIGKLHAPNWFIENQTEGTNPHEELDDPIKSCQILQKHVDEGLKIAKKNRLPKPIADFIPEHQGTLKMGYFLSKAREKGQNIEENQFRYKGPIPQSKETAILMLADGCEAALRAMDINATDKEAYQTISGIISSREKDGQLSESYLSKAEIFIIKKSFLRVWKRIRHRRIQYPTSKNNTFS